MLVNQIRRYQLITAHAMTPHGILVEVLYDYHFSRRLLRRGIWLTSERPGGRSIGLPRNPLARVDSAGRERGIEPQKKVIIIDETRQDQKKKRDLFLVSSQDSVLFLGRDGGDLLFFLFVFTIVAAIQQVESPKKIFAGPQPRCYRDPFI